MMLITSSQNLQLLVVASSEKMCIQKNHVYFLRSMLISVISCNHPVSSEAAFELIFLNLNFFTTYL